MNKISVPWSREILKLDDKFITVEKGKYCDVCGAEALKQFTVHDEESPSSYYCSQECKKYSTAKGKMIVGGVLITIGVFLLASIPLIGLILIVAGGIAVYVGNEDSKIVITTGKFATNYNQENRES